MKNEPYYAILFAGIFLSTLLFLISSIIGLFALYVFLQAVIFAQLILLVGFFKGIISLFFVLLVVLFSYTFSGYVDYLFFKGVVLDINFEYALLVYLSSLFSFFFVLPMPKKNIRGRIEIKSSPRVIIAIGVMALTCFIFYIVTSLDSFSQGFGSRRELLESRSFMISLLKFILPSLLALLYIVRSNAESLKIKNNITLAFIVAFVLSEFFIFGNRRMAAGLVIFVVVASNYKITAARLVVLLGFVSFLYIYQTLRAYDFSVWADVISVDMLKILNPMNTELSVFYRVGVDILSSEFSGGACTYCDIPAILVSSLTQSEVLTPAESYVKVFYRDIWLSGGGRAYSFILETYQNLWFLGPILIGTIMGRLVAYSESRSSAMAICILLLIYTNFLFFPRLSMVAAVKPAIPMLILFFLLFKAGKILPTRPKMRAVIQR